MSPVAGVLALASTEPLALDSIGNDSRLLDSDQFAVLVIAMALALVALFVIAVGTWRR